MKLPEIATIRSLAEMAACSSQLSSYAMKYEQCRLDRDFAGYLYGSAFLSAVALAVSAAAAGGSLLLRLASRGTPSWPEAAGFVIIGLAVAAVIFYFRLYAISSLKNYRGALIDANLVHAVGLMLAMADYDVPLKRMLRNLSNLGDVYGEEIALEATYALSLTEENGMDVISAIRAAQATSPSAAWQELLIGIAAVHNSGGSLREYLRGRHASLSDKKTLEVRKYNEKVQGASSIYLSAIGIAAVFVAIINLVFNMAGMLAGDALVWIDALVIVPAGSFVVIKILQAAYPEASPR
jgi:archaeal flagellar protein FlaJ